LGVRSTPEEVIALLYINIDNSKLINDTLGHGFGDAFIKGVSSRIERSLTHGEEIYRSGGDEFVILARAPNERVIKDRSDALMKLFAEPLHVNEMDIHTSISVGVAIYPGHAKSPQELMKCADIALFQAKKAGKNRVCFFSISMMAPINERMRIGEKLHGALQRGEFEIHYQPQICPESGTVASIEALLRWKNPVLGMVSPDTFIPVAEETLLIREIGSWVLRSACAFAKRLHDEGAAGLGVSVNISMVQILQEGFAGMVREAIASSGLDSSLLELEITESVLMESRSNVLAPLAELKAMGVGIALDDFGKGYSSLSYLQQLPITVLKIDKTFVDGISSKDPTASLAGNIVEIGKNLGLVVIAEGVETDDQLSFLRDRKCDKIQGWVYSKALPEAEAERFIRQNRGL
jgi:diguanylate cyclase (GGDEF)-like protein